MGCVAVTLEHRDPTLALPLFISEETDDATAEWRVWANVLGLPMLVTEDGGALREPFARMGGVRVDRIAAAPAPAQRHLQAAPVDPDAPRLSAALPAQRRSISGEREIIARN